MHSRASTLYGATIAPVGQASMQRVQLPQCAPGVSGASSGAISASVGNGKST